MSKKDAIKQFLAEMSAIPHVAGYEGELTKWLTTQFAPYAETSVDAFGNFVAHKKGAENAPTVMFAAHMDEIGLMVMEVCEGGFVKFTRIGGVDPRNLLAQEVIIHGREKIYGVIGIKPPHLTTPEERKKAVSQYDMSIDTGYSQEKLAELVRPGDIITFAQPNTELQNGRVAGKSLDNSVGVAALYVALQELQNYNHTANVYFVATAQEEVGVRGARTATYSIQPDIGIAVDVNHGRAPGLAEHETSELGKGPALCIGPNITRKLYEALKQTAVSNHTPYQIEVEPFGTGTDAYAIQVGNGANGGVVTGLVSIPLRYMHSTVEVAALSDIENCGKLLAQYIMGLTERGEAI